MASHLSAAVSASRMPSGLSTKVWLATKLTAVPDGRLDLVEDGIAEEVAELDDHRAGHRAPGALGQVGMREHQPRVVRELTDRHVLHGHAVGLELAGQLTGQHHAAAHSGVA